MISIVTGTLNRLPYLQRMVESIVTCTVDRKFELILVDGGSQDGTREWLETQCSKISSLRVIWQGRALGANAAFDAGFEIAVGRYVANLNDDVKLRGDVLSAAANMLDHHPEVGQVAIPYSNPDCGIHIQTIPAGKVPELLYANFGMTRRELGEALGWWRSDLYRDDAGDSHLSMSVWDQGYRVQTLNIGGSIEHLEVHDATRRTRSDSQTFFSYWRGWRGPNSFMAPELEARWEAQCRKSM
jgi:glycosyltransferase involved in cell wall biosynthesis